MPHPIPHVEINGTKYYSDRFYLNLPSGLDGVESDYQEVGGGEQVDSGPVAKKKAASPKKRTTADDNDDGVGANARAVNGGASSSSSSSSSASAPPAQSERCTCGHHNPPPLIDRRALVRSVHASHPDGGIVAAILSTYTLDPEWMVHELPELFPPNAAATSESPAAVVGSDGGEPVPTLILHGHKGLRLHQRRRRRGQGQGSQRQEHAAANKRDENMIASTKSNDRQEGVVVKGEKEEETRPPKIATETQKLGSDGRTVEVLCLDDDSGTDDGYAAEHRPPLQAVHQSDLAAPSRSDADDGNETDDDNGGEEDGQDRKVKEEEDEVPPEEGWRAHLLESDDDDDDGTDGDEGGETPGASRRRPRVRIFAKSVHVTEVLPTWVPPPGPNGSASRSGGRLGDASGRSVGAGGSASSPVALDDSSDEEGNEIIVIDPSDDECDKKGEATEGGAKSAAQQQLGANGGDDNIDQSLCVDPEVVKRRVRRAGVYHPKFMMLFERRGSVIVVVSTSNLTRTGACEGTWLQRFEPRGASSSLPIEAEGEKGNRSYRAGGPSDFGHVLTDFLKRQSDAAEENRITPEGYVRRYLGYRGGLEELVHRFRFEDAQVHLIPTVPGDYRGIRTVGRTTKQPRGAISRPALFGPQRVADILARVSADEKKRRKGNKQNVRSTSSVKSEALDMPMPPPSLPLTNSDRLVVQATSFGGNWETQNLEEIARSYMGLNSRAKETAAATNHTKQESSEGAMAQYEHTMHDDDLDLDSVDVVWPSQRYLNHISSTQNKRRRLEAEKDGKTSDPVEDVRGHFCHFATKIFNSINLSVLSRMVQFQTSVPPQMPWAVSPHIKTVVRLLPRDSGDRKTEQGPASHFQDTFAWAMLTSACMSRGAQGEATAMRGFESDEMSYRNVELGVLFCSSLGGDAGANRLYGFQPKQCSCTDDSSQNDACAYRTVHLPIPYKLRPPSYQADEEDVDFVETPFFHEITPGTGGAGQMGLTPLGRRLNSKARSSMK